MKKLNCFLIYFLALIVLSCSKQNTVLKEMVLKQDTVITQFNDSTYFSDIRTMFFDKYLYVSDYKRDQIIVLNNKAEVIKTLGRKGHGQGEFIGVSHIYVANDTIYAQNDMKRSIEVYTLDGYIKTVPLININIIQLKTDTRFFYLNNTFYLSTVTNQNSIVAYNIATDSIKHFGKIDRFATEKHTYFRNDRNILLMEGKYIIATSHVVPVVEKYNLKGDLIEEFNYKHILPVQKRLKFIETKKVEINSVYELISDAYIESNKLYLILISNNGDDVNSNIILEIEIGDKMKATNLYNLGEGWYGTMCITKNHLWAFDRIKGNLVRFTLNKTK